MNPIQIVTGIAQAVNSYLSDKLTQQWGQTAVQAINNLTNWVTSGWQGLVWTMTQERGSVRYSDRYAAQVGHDLEQVQGSLENTISHVAFTILPNSLAYTVGLIVSKFIVPLRQELVRDEQQINSIDARVTDIHHWLFPYVSDAVAGWYQFVSWWDHNFSVPAATLIDWLKHPDHFGTWAAPPVVGPLIAYLASQAHETTRDDLARIMVAAWSEKPYDILTAVEQWLVTEQGS